MGITINNRTLTSVISAIALDTSNLEHLRNKDFAEDAKSVAGRFEVVRIEIGAAIKRK